MAIEHEWVRNADKKIYWKAHIAADFERNGVSVSENGVGVGGDLFVDFAKMVERIGTSKFFIAPVELRFFEVGPEENNVVRSKVKKISCGNFDTVDYWRDRSIMKQITVEKYVLQEKTSGKFAKCFNDDYCCWKIELVDNIIEATIHDNPLCTDNIDKALRHAVSDERQRKNFDEILVRITYSF